MISERARLWAGHDAYLVRAHFLCAQDPFDPETNPRGFVNFGTAENYLVYGAIAPLLRDSIEVCEQDVHYNELHGARFLREAVAGFLSRRAGRPLSPDHIVLASGASAILELLAFVLCDPGTAILIPTPYYPGFDHDLALRSGADLIPCPLAGPRFELTPALLEDAYAAAAANGRRVGALLLNSPHNPSGHVYDEQLVRRVVEFADRHGVHVISDEIYAESLLPGVRHFTALRLASSFVHVVYGFAKDFGLSGYKVGILHSDNEDVIRAASTVAYFHTVSMLPQRALAGVLESSDLEGFLTVLRSEIEASYRHTTGVLEARGIPFVAAQGGIVLWIDLRMFLREQSYPAERELCETILRDRRVNISPGACFHCAEPGWFRLCHTIPETQRREGLRRLLDFLSAA